MPAASWRFFVSISSGTGKIGTSMIGDMGAGEDARAPGATADGMASGALKVGSAMSWEANANVGVLQLGGSASTSRDLGSELLLYTRSRCHLERKKRSVPIAASSES